MNQKERGATVTTSVSLPKGNIPVVKSKLFLGLTSYNH